MESYSPTTAEEREQHLIWLHFKRKYGNMDSDSFMREMERMESQINQLRDEDKME